MNRRATIQVPAMAILALTLLMGGCSRSDDNRTSAFEPTPCDLSAHPCEVSTLWGKLIVSLSPKPLPLLRPILIEARFADANGSKAIVELSGKEMDMGPNMTPLQRADNHLRHGTLIIPICLTGSMRWRLSLHLSEGARSETIHFEMLTLSEHASPVPTQH